MKNVSSKNHGVTNRWKKVLYSSIVFGAIFAGGQYISSVHANADSDDKPEDSITFHNDTTGEDVNTLYGDDGSTMNLESEIRQLENEGIDTSNIPNKIVLSDNGDGIIHVKDKDSDVLAKETDKYKFQIKIFDQNYNYIETKNYQSNNPKLYSEKVKDDLVSEGYPSNTIDGFDQFYDASTLLKSGPQLASLTVTVPEHILTIKYVDQDGKVAKTMKHVVTNYGYTDIVNDLGANYSTDDTYVDNKASNLTVNVIHDPARDDENFYSPDVVNGDFVEPIGTSVLDVANYDTNDNPMDYLYHTSMTFVDEKENYSQKYIISNPSDSIVGTSFLVKRYFNGSTDNTGFPNYIDINNGPYVVYVDGVKEGKTHVLSIKKGTYNYNGYYPVNDSNLGSDGDSNAVSNNSSINNVAPKKDVSDKNTALSETSNKSQVVAKTPEKDSSGLKASDNSQEKNTVTTKTSSSSANNSKSLLTKKPTTAQYKHIKKLVVKYKHDMYEFNKKIKILKKKMRKHATHKEKLSYSKLSKGLESDAKSYKKYNSEANEISKYFKYQKNIRHDSSLLKKLKKESKKLKRNNKKRTKIDKEIKRLNISLEKETKFVKNYKI